MIRMIRILTRISPGNMHFTRGQIDDHCRDRVLAIERVYPINIVIANGVRQVDMIFLDGLQRMNRMGGALPQ